MLITLNQLKTSLLAFKDWVLARIPSKTSDLTNDSGFITAGDETVKDVQVNGTSILDGDVANIPLTSDANYGLVKYGAGLRLDGSFLTIFKASNNQTKAGAASYSPIVPSNQHLSAFYGLAKAAGHDEKDSANPVGTYTDEAKAAIQTMLDVPSTADIPTKVSDLVDDSGHYTKPSGGIPASDLASGVIPTVPVQDVTVNGTSVVENGVAEIVQTDKSVWNMFVGTLNPDVSSADKYPHVDGQAVATMFRSCTPSVAEHGFRATATGMMRVDFGNENKRNLNGFEVGETYTLSCDLSANIIRPSSLDEVVANIEIQLMTYNGYYGIADGYVSRDIEDGEYGTDVDFGRVEFTFTVPERKDGMATTGAMIRIVPIINGTYALTEAGSYVEVRNLMLNKGNGASSWSPSLSEVVSEPPVQDVQINGTSIVNNGVANIPIANQYSLGVIKVSSGNTQDTGFAFDSGGNIYVAPASDASIKQGNKIRPAIVPGNQHTAVFYGLAKAAGDTTQSASSNAVGTYTDEAKAAIKNMLGIGDSVQTVAVSGTTPIIVAVANTRYVCGEVTSVDFTPASSGLCELYFESGSTVAVLTLPSTVQMPEWFEVEANTAYEISILDGKGAVTSWALS